MRIHHLLMIGAALVLIVVAGTGATGGPLGMLLLLGLLLLCPLMMLGMHGGGRPRAPSGSDTREGEGRDGR